MDRPDIRPEDRLALIEWIGRDQRVVRSMDVHHWPVTLGRGLHNTIVLEDPQVAEQHARIEPDAQGQLHLSVGATRNGLWVDHRHLVTGDRLPLSVSGVGLQLGSAQLRVRWQGEVLAPEEVIAPAGRWLRLGFWPAAGVALVWLVMLALQFWIGLDPGAEVSDWLPFALGAPLGLVFWCALWALGSKVFRHHFDFVGHLSVAAPGLLAMTVMEWLMPQVAASLDWPWIAELGTWVQTALMLALLWAHLRLVLPAPRGRVLRALNTAFVLLAVVGSTAYLTVQHRSTERWSTQLYLGTLPMPGLRFDRAEPVDRLLESVQTLRAPLEARVRKAASDEDEDSAEE